MANITDKFTKATKGFFSTVAAYTIGAIVIGSVVTLSLYNRYQGELQSVLRVYQLEETDKANMEKIQVESSFQSLRNTLVATAQTPVIQSALKNPSLNSARLAKELLPTFDALGAHGIHLVTPGATKPTVQTIGKYSTESGATNSELAAMMLRSQKQFPTITSVMLNDYPATIIGLTATPDPRAVTEPINQSFVYAIPLFDAEGKFAGVLGASLDTEFLTKKLSGPDRAVIQPSKGFVAYPKGFGTVESFWKDVQEGGNARALMFCHVARLPIPDTSGKWLLWTAKFDTDFWARSDVSVLRQNLVASALTTWALLGFGIILVSKIRRKQEERFQGLLRNSGEIILLCNDEGEIQQVGGQTRQLIGWRPDQLTKVNLGLFLSSETRRELTGVLEKVSKTPHSTDTVQVRVETPEKTLRWHELVATNLKHDAEVDGIVITLRNIEAQKAGELMLIQAKESAERANLAKSEFLSRMSHELRTPLNAILGFSQLLQMSELAEHDRESVDQVLKSGRHLLGLINDILDISRIETNNLSVSKEPVLVNELIADCVSNIQLLAQSRGIELDVKVPSEVYFRADRQRIAQVVINLLSNAVKYNRDGGKVFVEVTKTESDVYLSVRDTGNGIADELIPRLFTPFDRLGADRSRVEGTGLGLSLSKTLIEAMDGRINVLSKVGEGTTFVVALPATAPRKGVPLKLVNGFDENEIRILYIEDNEVNLELMQKMFADYSNIKLLEAREGWLGIAIAREHVPDLILLDNNLPDIDAVRVIEELRSNPVTRNIDIFVISADITSARISACIEAGAKQFIEKPIDINNLFSALEQNLKAA